MNYKHCLTVHLQCQNYYGDWERGVSACGYYPDNEKDELTKDIKEVACKRCLKTKQAQRMRETRVIK